VVRRGSWSQDVGHFLISALTESDRRAHDADLIAVYRDALELPDAEKPSAESMWLCYRMSVAYGFGVWLSTLGSDGYQSREISLALAQRFSSAFLELETMSALAQGGA